MELLQEEYRGIMKWCRLQDYPHSAVILDYKSTTSNVFISQWLLVTNYIYFKYCAKVLFCVLLHCNSKRNEIIKNTCIIMDEVAVST